MYVFALFQLHSCGELCVQGPMCYSGKTSTKCIIIHKIMVYIHNYPMALARVHIYVRTESHEFNVRVACNMLFPGELICSSNSSKSLSLHNSFIHVH